VDIANIIDKKKPAIKQEIQSLSRLIAADMRSQLVDKINKAVESAAVEFENKLMRKLGRINLDILKSPLPPDTRFIVPYKTSVVLVSEQLPTVRSVYLRNGYSEGSVYTLSFPYIIFAAKMQRDQAGLLHVACRTEPLGNINDQLYHVNLYNIYKGPSRLGICFPGGYRAKGTALESFSAQVKSFWHSSFYGIGNRYGVTKRHTTAKEWSRKTREDPSFILREKFTPAVTVKKLCDELAQEQRRGQIKLNENFRRDGTALIRDVGQQLGR
jgi:hypothetical protein